MWLASLRQAVISEGFMRGVLSPRLGLSGRLGRLITYGLDVGAAVRFVTLVCELYEGVCH